MMKGLVMDESMSNLTSTSGEISASSSATRIETTFASTNQAPPLKKKRSLPGNPDPDAEVIALSPKSLLATNRFICEICNKGFQRDQNLQLHRRGHNLPWKLKQRPKMEVIRKKVYVCPETTCVHHDPSRALGDLTGIKKHFSRKHGEKKWKCEKCSKRYAVQSDWKAHSKICGTKEYRCDCGTLFSRRDSFITHRAFCDALAEESARAIPTLPNSLLSSSQQQVEIAGSSVSHNLSTLQQQQPQVFHSQALQALAVKREQDITYLLSGRSVAAADHSLPPWLACSSSFLDPLSQNIHENPSQTQNPSSTTTTLAPFQTPTAASSPISPHMSATALLQKAAQMGVTMSSNKPLQSPAPVAMQRPHHMSGTAGFIGSTSNPAGSAVGLSARDHGLAFFGNKAAAMEQVVAATNSTAGAPSLLHDMMSSLSSTSGFDGSSSSFEQSFNGIFNPKLLGNNSNNFQEIHQQNFQKTAESQLSRSENNHERRGSSVSSNIIGGNSNNDGLTRDFLGLKAFPHRDFPNLAGFNHHGHGINSSPAYAQHNQHSHQSQTPWQVGQQRIVIRNQHGENLVGILHETGSKDVVIICHGFQSIKERIPMVSIANVLERQGISAFRFDFAGNGESEGSFMYGNYRREAEDLRAVVQHFCNKDRPVTAIIGHSKGGNVVLLYASKYNDVPTVVSISGRFNLEKGMEGRLGKDFLQRIKQNGFIDVFNRKGKFEYRVTQESLMDRLSTDTRAACLLIDQNCRVLIIHGSMDRIVPAKDALEFARFIRNHKLHIVEGADHEYTSHQDELTKIVLDFVREGRQEKNTTQDSQSCSGGVRSRI
ncbi:hypothetical protein CCACVL1_20900 [Corchorus capsularis]|uniref:C2H2-type domain-containing protein n=1 Tax=Corchorus capsularis TaxID=210143 RepID=A0A1R3H9H4_COCAP|nr:hypothetical protein CCACVL1_20900 [Corchorus capsularis]